MSGNTKQGGEGRNKGLYREKTKCVPNVLTFFLYIALRAFFFFSLSLSPLFFFSLVKFYFLVGTVGTVGTWRSDANLSGNIFCFFGNTKWEHGNMAWEHSNGNMGTWRGNILTGTWEHGVGTF